MTVNSPNNGAGQPGAAANGEQEPRPHINIRCRNLAGEEVQFKIRPYTKLQKVMDTYSARISRERKELRFMFDGQRVLDDDTPENVRFGLEDLDWPMPVLGALT